MTDIAFHFNAPDRLQYACRLLRKAYARGARLLVLADAPHAMALDQQLWTIGKTEFIPHCSAQSPLSTRRRSPIVITSELPEEIDPGHVLVNLSDHLPARFDRFARLIEVVTADDQVRQAARERWRHYKSAGHEPQHLDVQQRSAAA